MNINISVCENNHEYIWGQHIPLNAWYGCDSVGWWFCTVHGKPENDNELELRRFDGSRWIKVRENSETTRNICQWATAMHLWWTKCHWWKEEDAQKRLVTKQYNHMKSIENMMRHDRKHKSGGSGIRLDVENFRADKTFTDYECTNNHHRFHDFQKSYV